MIAIFDFFGVLVDWGSEYVLPQWAEAAGVSVDVYKRETRADFEACERGAISMGELWERNGRKYGISPEIVERILREQFVKRAKLNQAVVDIIGNIKKHGKVYLLSNQWPVHALICREKGWFDLFDGVFLSFELGARKPEKEAFLAVLKKIKAQPSECILIDDKGQNVDGAVAVGMRGILFKDSGQLQRELEKVYKVSLAK